MARGLHCNNGMPVTMGTSGWSYKHWRGRFYPTGLRQRDELAYLADQLNSVELNGTFYSLQRPDLFRAWHAQTPPAFSFAVKGSRFISHNKKLRDVDTALANFFASGVLLLREKLGPIVWQLPERMRFDAGRLEEFLLGLPRDTMTAAALATRHDARVDDRNWTAADAKRPLRYALEPRNLGFFTAECVDILRRHDVALVVADSGGVAALRGSHRELRLPPAAWVAADVCKPLLGCGARSLGHGHYRMGSWRSADRCRAHHQPAAPFSAAA
jgi:uncharacterized protein YecE (DUF72 family)